MTDLDKIESVVAAARFGRAYAARRGRRTEWPWVPVIDFGATGPGSVPRTRTEQIRGRAFATRYEAVEYAARTIEARRDDLRSKLLDPRHRALREYHGLPSYISVDSLSTAG